MEEIDEGSIEILAIRLGPPVVRSANNQLVFHYPREAMVMEVGSRPGLRRQMA